MVFEGLLNPIFSPVLALPPALGILLVSLIITVIITLVYKFTTNQSEIKRLRKEMKDYQTKLKAVSKTDPKKAMVLQKKAMEKNFEYMKHSMKPTLYTFLPIIIIFGWLNSHMAYYPLEPNMPFDVLLEFDQYVVGNVTLTSIPELEYLNGQTQQIAFGLTKFQLQGHANKYTLSFNHENKEYNKKIIITSDREYEIPTEQFKDSALKKIIVGNNKVRPFGGFSIFGWYPGWLATYIISSMIFSTGLRKLMKLA